MGNRKYRKKGLGLLTIALMVFSIAILVLPMNVAALGTWQYIYIDGYGPCYQGDTYDLDEYDIVSGQYANVPQPPVVTFLWKVNDQDWQGMDGVIFVSGTYYFWFRVDPDDFASTGILYLEATVETIAHNWWCYYD